VITPATMSADAGDVSDVLTLGRWRKGPRSRSTGWNFGASCPKARSSAQKPLYRAPMTDVTKPVRLAEGGSARFESFAARLPALLKELQNAPAWRGPADGHLPAVPGIYLLTERNAPIYIGQTRNLRSRLGQHRGASSRENQASLAFNIAKIDAAANRPSVDLRQTRRALEQDPEFAAVFRAARQRVAAMEVRVIEIDDPELRTVFEVYAAVAFGTAEHNSFETH
jgi:GIY-YIG catalytic domain